MAAAETVVVLGAGRQGTALARFYAQQGARVMVSDLRPAEELKRALEALAGLDIEFVLGEHPWALLEGCDRLCLSGGVPADLPLVQEAVRRGIPLTNDAQEFLARCPAPVVGVTGSAGKTTTTTLVGRMLEASGQRTWVGGNIGNPLLGDLDEIAPGDRVVMELSSFQLELMTLSPGVAGVLNITPNHLDRHGTMEAYRAAKAQIVAHQQRTDVAVLGYDDPHARALADATPAAVRYFSGQGAVASGAYLRGSDLVLARRHEEIAVAARHEVPLRGFHNVLNVLASMALADAAGADPEALGEAIRSFSGVPHRLEEVRSLRGVLWVNDSIATAPERVLAALEAFDEPLVLLAGGRDKDLPWQRFAERVAARVRVLVVFGEAAPLIAPAVRTARARAQAAGASTRLTAVVVTDTLEQAVAAAAARAQSGDVVLLSPGGTSFDAFEDFAQRGARFREYVAELS